MDDTSKQSGQTQPVQPQGGTLVQFPTPSGAQPLPQPQDQAGISTGITKEQEPFPTTKITPEMLTPSEKPVELEPEIKEAGVTEVTQVPTITEELAKAGVVASTGSLPPSSSKQTMLKTPMSLEKAESITKGSFLFKNPSSSLLWLALVVLRQLRMKKKEEETHAA